MIDAGISSVNSTGTLSELPINLVPVVLRWFLSPTLLPPSTYASLCNPFLDWGFLPADNGILSGSFQTISLKGRLNVGITRTAQLVRYNQLLSPLVSFPYMRFHPATDCCRYSEICPEPLCAPDPPPRFDNQDKDDWVVKGEKKISQGTLHSASCFSQAPILHATVKALPKSDALCMNW